MRFHKAQRIATGVRERAARLLDVEENEKRCASTRSKRNSNKFYCNAVRAGLNFASMRSPLTAVLVALAVLLLVGALHAITRSYSSHSTFRHSTDAFLSIQKYLVYAS
jgi:hypothetical protein